MVESSAEWDQIQKVWERCAVPLYLFPVIQPCLSCRVASQPLTMMRVNRLGSGVLCERPFVAQSVADGGVKAGEETDQGSEDEGDDGQSGENNASAPHPVNNALFASATKLNQLM